MYRRQKLASSLLPIAAKAYLMNLKKDSLLLGVSSLGNDTSKLHFFAGINFKPVVPLFWFSTPSATIHVIFTIRALHISTG